MDSSLMDLLGLYQVFAFERLPEAEAAKRDLGKGILMASAQPELA